MNFKYQLEIDNGIPDKKDRIKKFKKDVEFGMNLYYDLWTMIFDPYNDHEKIKGLCLEINKFSQYLSSQFNAIMKFDSKNEKIILLYEQYLTNYANDKAYAKFLTERLF